MKDVILRAVDWVTMAVVWALFVLWQNYQSDGAQNLLLAYVWFMMFWHILVILGASLVGNDSETARKVRDTYKKNTTHVIVARISNAAMYCALAWIGYLGLAVVAAIIWVLEVCRIHELIEGDQS